MEIRRIKLIIDGTAYSWDAGAEKPVSKEGIRPDAVLSFTSLHPGLHMDLQSLEWETESAQRRLRDSGLFYSVRVSILPARQYPTQRTVLVEVTTGFLHRFGGGNLFAFYGLLGIGGGRNSLGITAGYTNAAITWSDEAVAGSPFRLSGGISYENPLMSPEIGVTYHRGQIRITGGWAPHPDSIISLGAECNAAVLSWQTEELPAGWLTPDSILYAVITPAYEQTYSRGIFRASGTISLPAIIVSGRDMLYSILVKGNIQTSLESFSFPLRAEGRLSSGQIPWFERKKLSESMLSPQNGIDSVCDSYAFVSFEPSLTITDSRVLPLLHIRLDLTVFAQAAASLESDFLPEEVLLAAGAGVRLRFLEPVFTSVTLSWGWNQKGLGGFFCTIKGDNQ